jgi:rhodanese-related sulfurtransferase
MKRQLLAVGLLTGMLAAGHALAQEAEAYRETKLGLYLDALEAYELLQENERAVLIDVRDPVEIKFTGFAEPTDIHVPWVLADRDSFDEEARTWPMVRNSDFEAQVKERLEALGVAEDDPIIVICRSGSTRSAPGADALHAMGYSQVYSVSDGFEGTTLKEGDSKGVRAVNGWRNSGLPWSYEIDPSVAWRPAE